MGMRFDFIMISPPYHPPAAPLFVFGHGVSLFGGFACPPVDGLSTASCDFSALTGRDE